MNSPFVTPLIVAILLAAATPFATADDPSVPSCSTHTELSLVSTEFSHFRN